ncbi:MAG: hypothetical protein F6K10_37425 [Moorea sp. SIO2B7]|nr:hypothetical protein [Moorena sp. SIO2B7]
MSVSPRPLDAARHYRSRKPVAIPRAKKNFRQHRAPLTPVPSRIQGQKGEKIAKIPNNVSVFKQKRQNTPWLRALILLYQSSSIVTFFLIATSLGIYGWTVCTQKEWSGEYKKLVKLQRDERHLTEDNETLKNQLAEKAEKPEMGLIAPKPTNTIFIPPTPEKPKSNPSKQKTVKISPVQTLPLGY